MGSAADTRLRRGLASEPEFLHSSIPPALRRLSIVTGAGAQSRVEKRPKCRTYSSSRIGCCKKISRARVQRNLISYSCSWTGLPGRLPRTMNRVPSFSTTRKGRIGERYGAVSCCVWVVDPLVDAPSRPRDAERTLKQPVDDRVEINLAGRFRHCRRRDLRRRLGRCLCEQGARKEGDVSCLPCPAPRSAPLQEARSS